MRYAYTSMEQKMIHVVEGKWDSGSLTLGIFRKLGQFFCVLILAEKPKNKRKNIKNK